MKDLLGLGLLNGHPLYRDGQFNLWWLCLLRTLRFFELLVELQLLDPLFDDLDTLRFVHFRAPKELQNKEQSIKFYLQTTSGVSKRPEPSEKKILSGQGYYCEFILLLWGTMSIQYYVFTGQFPVEH